MSVRQQARTILKTDYAWLVPDMLLFRKLAIYNYQSII